MTKKEMIQAVLKFWSQRWCGPTQAGVRFLEILEEWLNELGNSTQTYHELYVDYDPQQPLLDMVRQAGVECSGSFFSANMFNGTKFGVFFDLANKTVRFKLGYAKPGETIFWKD